MFRSAAIEVLAGTGATPEQRQAAIAEQAWGFLQGPFAGNGLLYFNSTNALMYRAAATLADVDVVSNAVTVTGQHGIGIATVDGPAVAPGMSSSAAGSYLVELVFDATTYQQIGLDYYPLHGYLEASARIGA